MIRPVVDRQGQEGQRGDVASPLCLAGTLDGLHRRFQRRRWRRMWLCVARRDAKIFPMSLLWQWLRVDGHRWYMVCWSKQWRSTPSSGQEEAMIMMIPTTTRPCHRLRHLRKESRWCALHLPRSSSARPSTQVSHVNSFPKLNKFWTLV